MYYSIEIHYLYLNDMNNMKVAAKLHWNSRDDRIVGHSMTSEEMSTLSDLYEVLLTDPQKSKTDYILQTLWRDLTSECDIIGPYYTSCGSLEAKTTLACVYDALRKFEAHGFNVCALVCDGASSNLTMIKILLGKKGVFAIDPTATDKHKLDSCFINPFSGDKIHVIICPSHQLKNMISALYESRSNGASRFEKAGVKFGWKEIENMMSREFARKKNNELPHVPGLKENFVYRDSWTRLNVKPAKIMQQEYVLSELYEYSHQSPPPEDSKCVQETRNYLLACNKLFERGILGKRVFIKSNDNPITASMKEGYEYFSNWLDEKLLEGYNITTQSDKKFISWQTWDLLKLMYYGFCDFSTCFLEKHPGYTIYPIRINGSAIETLFSQLKHTTSGQLSSVNYSTARATVITKGSVHGKMRRHRGDYRDAPLFHRKHPLTRKPFKRSKN